MRLFPASNCIAVSVVCASVLLNAAVQEPKDTPPAPAPSQSAYQDSADDLKKLVEDIFAAMKSGDEERTSTYFASLAFPDRAWFTKMFGSVEGQRLEAKYTELLPEAPANIKGSFQYAMKGGRTNVEVSVLQKSGPVSGLGRAILEAMAEPTPLYVVSGSSPKEQYGAAIGDFVYVEGGFRYLDTQVSQALTTAPPPRIRVGGNTQLSKLMRKVAPIYPDEAIAAHAQGSVLLHVVIGADGKMNDVTVVSGDPVLAKAAVDAVRQWQYQPTLLNGKPVEVDSTIKIDFRR
jgi:TonB family protein